VSFTGTEEKSNFQSLILQMKVRKPDLVYFGASTIRAACSSNRCANAV